MVECASVVVETGLICIQMGYPEFKTPDVTDMVRMGKSGVLELMLATAVSPLNGSKKTTLELTAQVMPAPDNRIWMLVGECSQAPDEKVGRSLISRTAVEIERNGGVNTTETRLLSGTAVRDGTGTEATHMRISRKP
jgi:hypothetical protein